MKLENRIRKFPRIRNLVRDESGGSNLIKTFVVAGVSAVVGLGATVPVWSVGEYTQNYIDDEPPKVERIYIYNWDLDSHPYTFYAFVSDKDDDLEDLKVEIRVKSFWPDPSSDMEYGNYSAPSDRHTYNFRGTISYSDYEFHTWKDYIIKIVAEDPAGKEDSKEFKIYGDAETPGLEPPATILALISALGLSKYLRRQDENQNP